MLSKMLIVVNLANFYHKYVDEAKKELEIFLDKNYRLLYIFILDFLNVFRLIFLHFFIGTFSTNFRSVLMLRIHHPTPTALSSDHCGSPLCMAGIMFSSSSSASEWKAHAKWHVERPGMEMDGGMERREKHDWLELNLDRNRFNKSET